MNRGMSYTDPPPHRPRYPVLAPYEDGYSAQAGYPGTAAPPWERQPRPASYDVPGRPGFAPPDLGQSYSVPEPSTRLDNRGTGGFPGAADFGDAAAYRDAPDYGDAPGYGDALGYGDAPGYGQASDFGEPSQRAAAPAGPDVDQWRPRRRSRGLLAGGAIGFLAAAVAIGVANLVAAFVRPQASPIIAVGGAFIDRTPPALKNFAVQKFGENDKNMLLLGMYVTIALIAIVIGMLAWRYLSAGVAGIGIFGLFGAFVAITRPESHTTDVIPSIAGGIAGIIAIVWLIHIGTSDRRYGAYPAEGDL